MIYQRNENHVVAIFEKKIRIRFDMEHSRKWSYQLIKSVLTPGQNDEIAG